MNPVMPIYIASNSPYELRLVLDNLIRSPLCPHTRDWICCSYLRRHLWVVFQLDVYVNPFQQDRPFSMRCGNSPESVPLDLAELASYIKGLNKPTSLPDDIS